MKKIILLIISISCLIYSQDKNIHKGKFITPKNDYYEKIKSEIEEFNKKEKSPDLSFKVDFSNLDLPKSKSEFTYMWHQEPSNQGMTGTCWSFSTTSYFESEIFRINNRKIKLSEMYNAYCEYLEKAKRFLFERGESFLGEGSEANAIKRLWPKYGCLPYSVYSGKLEGQKVHDHSVMFDEIRNYLFSCKDMNFWNEEIALENIKSILNKYMGKPPERFSYEGKEYTPKEFFEKIVNLNMDDYIDVISLKQSPYYTLCEYTVPDNWWHDKSYYNVPLDEYMEVINKSIQNGYTIVIGGDVSEAGIDSHEKVAIVPSFDIPSEYINEDAKQFRFSNSTTQDDHGIHMVGYKKDKDGKMWYLIKDSGAGSFNTGDLGYYFYNADYVKLKIVDFMIHKDAIKETLKKFNK